VGVLSPGLAARRQADSVVRLMLAYPDPCAFAEAAKVGTADSPRSLKLWKFIVLMKNRGGRCWSRSTEVEGSASRGLRSLDRAPGLFR
jgi:hypothetical protein